MDLTNGGLRFLFNGGLVWGREILQVSQFETCADDVTQMCERDYN